MTIIVVNFLLQKIGVPASNFVFFYLDPEIRDHQIFRPLISLLSLFVVLILITGLGFFSRYVIGRMFLSSIERMVDHVPGVNTVYRTVKQIVDTFSSQQKAVFQQSVLIEYPRKGVWVLGFLTSDAKGEPQERTASNLKNIFVPTTPNPTSGFLLMVPDEEIIYLDMSIGEGMKLIISGGAVTPPFVPRPDSPPEPVLTDHAGFGDAPHATVDPSERRL